MTNREKLEEELLLKRNILVYCIKRILDVINKMKIRE